MGQFLQMVPVVNHPYLPVDLVVQVQIQVGFMRQIQLSFFYYVTAAVVRCAQVLYTENRQQQTAHASERSSLQKSFCL